MIGRADIEGSKSNVAMNAWLPQASSLIPWGARRPQPKPSSVDVLSPTRHVPEYVLSPVDGGPVSRGSSPYLKPGRERPDPCLSERCTAQCPGRQKSTGVYPGQLRIISISLGYDPPALSRLNREVLPFRLGTKSLSRRSRIQDMSPRLLQKHST